MKWWQAILLRSAQAIFFGLLLVAFGVAYADWENTGDAPSGSKAIATAFGWLTNAPHLELTTDAIWNGAKYNNIGTWGTGGTVNTGNIIPNFCSNAGVKFTLSTTTGTLANPLCVNEGETINILIQQNSASPPGGGGDLISSWGTFYHFSGGTKPTLSTTVNLWDLIQCSAVLSPGTSTVIGVCSAVTNPT